MPTQTIKRTFGFFLMGLFILFQVYLVFIKDYRVLDYSRYMNEFPQPLFGEGEERQVQKVSQGFRTPAPLARIDIMLGNYAATPKNGSLQLGIYRDKQCLFLSNHPANEVKDNQFHSFVISTAKIPAGSYFLELRFSSTNREDRLAVWTCQKDIYPYGEFFVNGKKQAGDMTFRVYYRSTLWKAGSHWLEKMPSLWYSRVWLIIGFVLVVLALNCIFYYCVNAFGDQKPF
jgi:hypothetical protein